MKLTKFRSRGIQGRIEAFHSPIIFAPRNNPLAVVHKISITFLLIYHLQNDGLDHLTRYKMSRRRRNMQVACPGLARQAKIGRYP